MTSLIATVCYGIVTGSALMLVLFGGFSKYMLAMLYGAVLGAIYAVSFWLIAIKKPSTEQTVKDVH